MHDQAGVLILLGRPADALEALEQSAALTALNADARVHTACPKKRTSKEQSKHCQQIGDKALERTVTDEQKKPALPRFGYPAQNAR